MTSEDYEKIIIICERKNGEIKSYIQGRIQIMNNQKYHDFNSLTEIGLLKNYDVSKEKLSLIEEIINNNIQILNKSGKNEIKTEL